MPLSRMSRIVLAAHAAQADSGNVIAGLNRRQTIGQAHGDVLRQAVVGHGTVGRLKRCSGHFPRHGRRNSAAVYQGHRQVGVVRADIGQAGTRRYVRGHALQALRQGVFVQR